MTIAAAPKDRSAALVLVEHLGRHQSRGHKDAERHQDGVVGLAEHWDEVRDEVDRAHDVRNNHQHEGLGVPGHPRIARCKEDGIDVPAQ